MYTYKNYFFILFLFFPFTISAQNLECCSSLEEIEKKLSGYWKINDVTSKGIYHYWFENGRGNTENVEVTETIGKYLPVEKSHSFIYIKKKNNSYILEYIYKYGKWSSVIKKLDENILSLETNGELTEYSKVKY